MQWSTTALETLAQQSAAWGMHESYVMVIAQIEHHAAHDGNAVTPTHVIEIFRDMLCAYWRTTTSDDTHTA